MIARLMLRPFFEQHYATDALAGKAAGTFEQYRLVLDRLEHHAGEPVALDQLGKRLLVEYRAARLAAGRAAPTCNKELRLLRALWQYAYDEEFVDAPPRKIRPLVEPKLAPAAWSVEQMSQQLATAGTLGGTYLDIPRRLFWPALLLTLYDSGGRITAVMLCERGDYDPAHGLLHLRWDDQKQKADQVLRLHAHTRRWLDLLIEWRYPRLFPWSADPDHKWRTLRKHYRRLVLAPCGLPTGRKDMFHRVRRTTGTYMWDAVGAEATRDHLGHSSVAVTEAYRDDTKMQQRGRTHAADVLPRPEVPSAPDVQRRLF